MTHNRERWLHQLYDKGLFYWLRIISFMAVGLLVGKFIGQGDIWREVRYKIYHFQTTKLGPSHPLDLRVAFVLIGDDEYWTGKLARRVPIKRDYLANLIRAVEKANPAVIAVDFDLHSPTPDGSLVENSDYSLERDELLRAIKDVASKRPVVIPKSLVCLRSDRQEICRETSDIFGSELTGVPNIFPGYIQFAPDLRMIPARLRVVGRSEPMDSFALAVLHAYSPDLYEGFLREERDKAPGKEYVLRFGSFLDERSFTKLSYSANDVLLEKPDVFQRLNHQIAILGGRWHLDGYGAGDWNDQHLTPTGKIVGVYVHANYAEALRLGKYYPEVSKSWIVPFEVLLVVAAGVLLALNISKWFKIAATLLPSLFVMAVSYFFLQNLGLFFDFFIPMCVLAAHNLIEHLEWRKDTQI